MFVSALDVESPSRQPFLEFDTAVGILKIVVLRLGGGIEPRYLRREHDAGTWARSTEFGNHRAHTSAPGGTRTPNQPGRNRRLYPLSYGRRD